RPRPRASGPEQRDLPRLRALGEALEFGAGALALGTAGARQIFADAQVSLTPELAAAVTGQPSARPVTAAASSGVRLTCASAKICWAPAASRAKSPAPSSSASPRARSRGR